MVGSNNRSFWKMSPNIYIHISKNTWGAKIWRLHAFWPTLQWPLLPISISGLFFLPFSIFDLPFLHFFNIVLVLKTMALGYLHSVPSYLIFQKKWLHSVWVCPKLRFLFYFLQPIISEHAAINYQPTAQNVLSLCAQRLLSTSIEKH